MSATATGCKILADTLAVLSQKKATGKLLLHQGEQQWQLYFMSGSLIYATGGLHRSRRWYRAVAEHCPDFRVDLTKVVVGELWEYQLLQHGLAESEMSPEQARGIVRSSLNELLFAICGTSTLSRQWQSTKHPICKVNPFLLISAEELKQLLEAVKEQREQWESMGLRQIDPEQAPKLRESPDLRNRVSSGSLLTLSNHFNGQNTLWDIAARKKQPLTVTTRILHHFLKQGLIDFRVTPDLPSPIEQWRLAAAIIQPFQPLIACIDDSPMVCEVLEQILVGAGYRVLKITDPMQGIATLAKQKPDLIFLDIVMPRADGFTLCNFLRKTPVFRDTPIVFLTGSDGFIDRTRAKWTGATDFLSKPPSPDKVLQVAGKYLQPQDPASSASSNDAIVNPGQFRLASNSLW